MEKRVTKIAIIGAGIFMRTQYIPILSVISHLFSLKAIWSRSEESARGAVEIARKHFPEVECKWGDNGLDEIIHDPSIIGAAVVLAGQTQVNISLRLLKAGKHVLQEKPAAPSISELETALSSYESICAANLPGHPIWAVAENFRYESAFIEGKKLMADIGDVKSIQVINEGSMNCSNPYFTSSWRRNLTGGFILDKGVHIVAGLRMLVGCEIVSVSATTSHVDTTLPPPDKISSLFQLENGCSGVFVMVVSARSPQIFWRVVGSKGTLHIERGIRDGRPGYLVSLFYDSDGKNMKSKFFPFDGVNNELKAFIHDISQTTNGIAYEAEPRLSFVDGARDVAVVEAMFESGARQGARVRVKKF